MRTLTTAIAALLLAVTAAAAQVQIDQRRPASKNGEVWIENASGSTTVIGWEREEVSIKGHLTAGAEGIDIEGDKESISISAETSEDWHSGRGDDSEPMSNLVIHVPKGSAVHVDAVTGNVSVEGVEGTLGIETISGDITISGKPKAIEVDTFSGTTEIDASAAEMDLETVSGDVRVRGASRALSVTCVSGDVDIVGNEFGRAKIQSIAGDVRIEGSFLPEGEMEVDLHSGDVEILVPPDVAARFHLVTYSGEIESELGPKPRRTEDSGPYVESRFTIGQSDFEVSVETFSGDITVRVMRAGSPDDTKPPSSRRTPASSTI